MYNTCVKSKFFAMKYPKFLTKVSRQFIENFYRKVLDFVARDSRKAGLRFFARWRNLKKISTRRRGHFLNRIFRILPSFSVSRTFEQSAKSYVEY